MFEALKQVSLSQRLRIYIVRSLLLSSLVSIAFSLFVGNIYRPLTDKDKDVVLEDPLQRLLQLVGSVLVVFHHSLSVFELKWYFFLPDLVWILLEAGTFTYLVVFLSGSGQSLVVAFQCGMLLLLIVPRVHHICAHLSRSGRKGLLSSLTDNYHLLEGTQPYYQYHRLTIIFGRMYWREYIKSESHVVRLCRTLFLLGVLLSLAAFAIYDMLVQPSEAPAVLDHIHMKDFYSKLSGDKAKDELDMVVVYTLSNENAVNLQNAVSLSQQCSGQSQCVSNGTSDGQLADIFLHDEPSSYTGNDTLYDAVFSCPSLLSCNTVLTVNYTALPASSSSRSIYVLVGHHDAGVKEMAMFTDSITIRRGSHFWTVIDYYFRRPLSSPGFTALGLGDIGIGTPNHKYPVAKILQFTSDPDPSTSTDGNVATLRLSEPELHSPFWKESQVVLEHTVLEGVSKLGGLWTFVNGLFISFWGGSILYFLLGQRPLSLSFGLVHLLNRQRIGEELKRDYPMIDLEGGQAGDPHAGSVAFMKDYFLGSFNDTQGSRMRVWEGKEKMDLNRSLSFTMETVDHGETRVQGMPTLRY